MPEDIETEIRRALDAKAHEVDVPVDLMRRTLDAAREAAQPSLRDRLRARLDGWRLRVPVTGYPRWMYAGAAAAAAVLLFAVGTVVTERPTLDRPVALEARDEAAPRARGGEPRDLKAEATEGATTERRAGQGAGGSVGSAPGAEPDIAVAPGQVSPPMPPVPQRPGAFPPKIVRTANAEIEVRSFSRAWDRANAVAARFGGFVTSAESGLERGTITMRIPAAKLDAALGSLRKLGKVVQLTAGSEDVSAQIVDIDARVRALETEELQLLELLRRASGVSQVLEVRDRLNGVRQEIESLKAQKEYFANQVEFSTITATIYERGADPDDEPGDGILLDAWRTALRVGLTILAGTLVVAGGLIPLAAVAFGVWAIVRMTRRGRTG